MCVEPRKQLSFKKILEGIKNDRLYGFLFVKAHIPDELKHEFADFRMIIKNAMTSRKDPYMLKIAEERGCLKKTRYFGKTSSSIQKLQNFIGAWV